MRIPKRLHLGRPQPHQQCPGYSPNFLSLCHFLLLEESVAGVPAQWCVVTSICLPHHPQVLLSCSVSFVRSSFCFPPEPLGLLLFPSLSKLMIVTASSSWSPDLSLQSKSAELKMSSNHLQTSPLEGSQTRHLQLSTCMWLQFSSLYSSCLLFIFYFLLYFDALTYWGLADPGGIVPPRVT